MCSSDLGRFRPARAAKELDIEYEKIGTAVGDLKKQGWLKRVSRGVYEYVDREAASRPARKMDAVWTAMRLSPTWTVKQIARQAGVSTNYATKLVQTWRRAGWVKQAGQKRPEFGYGREIVYRLRDRTRLSPPGRIDPDQKQDPFKALAWKALGRILLDNVKAPGDRDDLRKELGKLLEMLDEKDKEE